MNVFLGNGADALQINVDFDLLFVVEEGVLGDGFVLEVGRLLLDNCFDGVYA